MQGIVKPGYTLLALQMLAFHPVWRWYANRLTDGSDEPWGLLALATGLLLLVSDRGETASARKSLLLPALLTIVYALAYPFSPRLVHAAIAVVSLGWTLAVMRTGKHLPAPILGLFLISVPLVPSLQFYGGYPLRVVSGMLAAPLLGMSGLAVWQDGACLRWGGELVVIDAPCSGVRMLWVGLYLALTIAAVWRMSPVRTLLTAMGALAAVVLGNAVRAASLFHLETGIVHMPSWSHDAVGVIVFAITGILIAYLAHRLARRGACATHGSS